MKKILYTLLVAVTLVGSSCEDFLSVNEKNPNNASEVAPKLMLPAAMNNIAATLNNPRRFDFIYLWHGLWSISAGYSQPQGLVQYKLLNSDYQNMFRESYIWGNNLTTIEKNSTGSDDVYYLAVAKILKTYIFQYLVDCYGDVPYSEAFKAEAGILKPKYDDQEEIYTDLVVKLNEAIALIQNAPSTANALNSSSDIIYHGDMAKWLKFANTLKLRILVQQSGIASKAAYIAAEIANTASVGYIGEGDGALCNPGFVESDGKMNPFYQYFYNAAGASNSDGVTYYFAGNDVVDYMNTLSDPRIGMFFQTNSSGAYAGNIFGNLPANLASASSTSKLGYSQGVVGTMIGTPTKAAPLFTDFEALFLEAEAAQRGLITADAKALYESAMTRSFVYMGLTAGNAAAFYSSENANINFGLSAPTDKLNLILKQKWVALNGISPVTIWSDYRRTGIPSNLNFSSDPAKAGPGTPPVRLAYPQDELNVNSANVLAVGTINVFTSKIFWQTR